MQNRSDYMYGPAGTNGVMNCRSIKYPDLLGPRILFVSDVHLRQEVSMWRPRTLQVLCILLAQPPTDSLQVSTILVRLIHFTFFSVLTICRGTVAVGTRLRGLECSHIPAVYG